MKFVIIEKTYKNSDRTKGKLKVINRLFPDDYPMTVSEKEYGSLAEAQKDNVGKGVVAADDYRVLMSLRRVDFKDAIRARKLKQDEISRETQLNNEE